MEMADRETIIETGDGGAAGIVAGLLVVALIVVGLLFFFNVGNRGGAAIIDLDAPAATADAAPRGQ